MKVITKNIIFEKRNNNMIYYIRDSSNNLIGFKYNNDIYYYIKNLQNDIIGILDSNYNLIVNYRYDSWGNILSITDINGNDINDDNHVGNINPFRYRSYYYDTETNLYYLNSRYYSPVLKRFLNSDNVAGANQDIMAYNTYAYCNNNPIVRVDSHGGAWIWNVACTIVGGAIGAGSQIVSNIVNDEPLFDGVLGATVSGGTAGLLISFGCTDPFLLSYGTTAAGAISEEVSDYVVTGKDFSYSSFVDSANKVFTTVVVDGTVNLVAGKMADKVAPVNMGEGTARTLKSAFTGKHAKK